MAVPDSTGSQVGIRPIWGHEGGAGGSQRVISITLSLWEAVWSQKLESWVLSGTCAMQLVTCPTQAGHLKHLRNIWVSLKDLELAILFPYTR